MIKRPNILRVNNISGAHGIFSQVWFASASKQKKKPEQQQCKSHQIATNPAWSEVKYESLRNEVALQIAEDSRLPGKLRHTSSSKRDTQNQLGEISFLVIQIRSILHASLFIPQR